jgi:hypothetical protein
LWWLVRSNEISLSTKLARVVWPATLVLSLGLAALGYYNYRVTGNPWKLPYQLHLETYARSPVFLWQTPYPDKQYRNEQLRNFHNGWELADHAAQQTLTGFYRAKLSGTRGLWEFFLGAMLTIPLVMLPSLLTSRKLRFAFVAFAAVFAASLFVPWMFPHYFAPAAPLLVLLVVSGLRWLRVATRRMRPISRWLAPALLLLLALSTANLLFRFARYEPVGWQYDRARILAELEDAPHRHLVLVRYGPRHNSHNEWVTNRADLDAAKVVWAREISPDSDAALRNYYADRQAWLLEADAPRPRLAPYSPR